MDFITSLDAVSESYDAVFCDVWGVVHNGRTHFPAAVKALQRVRARGKVVLLLTNVPKPRDPIPGQLDRLGVPRDAWDAIVTSGDAIRAELAPRAPGPMYKIGPSSDASLWAGLGLAFTSDISQAAFFGISGLNHDDYETPEDYADVLREARTHDLDLICANPDIVVRVGDHLVWCAGAIARDYTALGGRSILAGKPHAPIYQLAFQELKQLTGRVIDKSRILAIGDGVGTDLLGAMGAGLDCLFIASGMHGEALKTAGALDPVKIETALAAEGARARFVMPALV
jgi:HAD superfamily hydrolase (TIGR01459 family)